jgi:uncharacterized coiled-coil protein SlyX
MTQAEKYTAILNALAEVLAEKDRTISYQNWKIEDLEKKLKEAEATRETNKEGETA